MLSEEETWNTETKSLRICVCETIPVILQWGSQLREALTSSDERQIESSRPGGGPEYHIHESRPSILFSHHLE
jgi:hypothetical protein